MCDVVRGLADRLAKLEAAASAANQVARPTEPHAALRDYLAQDKSLDELMPSPWQVEMPAAAGPIPPRYKLAPGWHGIDDVDATCDRDESTQASFERADGALSCAAHAVEMQAIVKVEPPAEQPASASNETLDYETTDGCIFCRKRVQDPDEEKCLHCRPAPAQGAPDSNHCPKHPSVMVRAGRTYPGGVIIPALACGECELESAKEASKHDHEEAVARCHRKGTEGDAGGPGGSAGAGIRKGTQGREDSQVKEPVRIATQGAPAESSADDRECERWCGHQAPAATKVWRAAVGGRDFCSRRCLTMWQRAWKLAYATLDQPPALDSVAPTGSLSATLERMGMHCSAQEAKDLEARLAAAERSARRHRLTLDEERRCYGILKTKLAAAETEKATLSTHCVRAERIAQERKEALAATERERDEDGSRAERLVEIVRRLERERDEALVSVNQAVAAERERCLYHIEEYEPRRDVPADWSYQGELSRIAETIRDGRQAPK